MADHRLDCAFNSTGLPCRTSVRMQQLPCEQTSAVCCLLANRHAHTRESALCLPASCVTAQCRCFKSNQSYTDRCEALRAHASHSLSRRWTATRWTTKTDNVKQRADVLDACKAAHLHIMLEPARCGATVCEDCSAVAVGVAVDQLNGLVQAVNLHRHTHQHHTRWLRGWCLSLWSKSGF